MSGASFSLRRYRDGDEAAAIELWRRTWQRAYPTIDFAQRLAWWRARWRNELVPAAVVTIAERETEMLGFVTVDPSNGYLDALVVAPEEWGGDLAGALIAQAKRCAPAGLDLLVNQDNGRAIRFYEKHGFVVSGADKNPLSGAPLHRMRWQP